MINTAPALVRPTHTLTSMMPFTIGANFDHDVGGALWLGYTRFTPLRRLSDLRLVYISVVPLATMTQALTRCWICAHCQRAPVTIGAKFTTNVGWRAAHIVILIGTVLALMPTYAYFNGNDTIQDWR
ncbi:hypothetical protein BZG13_13195 [Salinivibrio sp. ML323]|nr:hypothetical protein BZG13_13195 [Salinivibrio sp. ML323]